MPKARLTNCFQLDCTLITFGCLKHGLPHIERAFVAGVMAALQLIVDLDEEARSHAGGLMELSRGQLSCDDSSLHNPLLVHSDLHQQKPDGVR